MRHGHELTNSQYRQLLGVDSRVATRELSDLVGRDLVVQKGTRRWATYELRPEVAAVRRERKDRREEILRVLRDRGELSADEIAGALKIGGEAVRRWLRILRTERAVELTTKSPRSPRTKYRAVAGRRRRRAYK
jgi:ATP-dependent DNA helicase RecG